MNSSKVSEHLCKIYSRNAYFQIINCTYIWIINVIKEMISYNQIIIASTSYRDLLNKQKHTLIKI